MGSLTGAIAGARGAVRLITRRPWSPILISPAPDLLLARRVHGGTGLPWSGMVSTPMLHGVGRRFVASSTTEAASRRRDRADGRERTGPARLTGPAPVRLYEAPARPFLKKDIDDLLQRAKSLKLYCSGGPRNNVTPEEDEQLLRAVCVPKGYVWAGLHVGLPTYIGCGLAAFLSMLLMLVRWRIACLARPVVHLICSACRYRNVDSTDLG